MAGGERSEEHSPRHEPNRLFSFERLSLTPTLSRRERENFRPTVSYGERSSRLRGSKRDFVRGNLTLSLPSDGSGEETEAGRYSYS